MFSVVIYYLLTGTEVVTGKSQTEAGMACRISKMSSMAFFLNLEEKYVKSLILKLFLTKQLNFLGKIIKL